MPTRSQFTLLSISPTQHSFNHVHACLQPPCLLRRALHCHHVLKLGRRAQQHAHPTQHAQRGRGCCLATGACTLNHANHLLLWSGEGMACVQEACQEQRLDVGSALMMQFMGVRGPSYLGRMMQFTGVRDPHT